jgi:hypothetical protein
METFELDRIYSWLSSALGYNQKAEKKYLYDRKDKLFFNLGFKDGQYFIWPNPIPLSNKNKKIVEGKIPNLVSGDSEVIVIVPTSTKFQHPYYEQPNSIEEFDKQVKKEEELHKEVESFLQRNNINVHETALLE